MPDFFPTKRELTIDEIVTLTGAKPRPSVRSSGASATSRRLIAARAVRHYVSRQREISRRAGGDARRGVPVGATLRGAGAQSACRAGDAGALSGLRRGGARAVSRGAAAVLAVRRERPLGRCARACFGADRGGRDHRSVGGDRARRRDRGGHADRAPARSSVRGVAIGRDCAIGAGATVLHALIGDRVIIHAGARIGQDGFGYLPSPRGHQKIPQTRRVIIQDDVEIGANTTIDRGSTRDTVIGEGTKIDNLVQIAHNVSIGRHCLIAGQTGISGSSQVGDFVMMGGQVGLGRPCHRRRRRHAGRAERRHV